MQADTGTVDPLLDVRAVTQVFRLPATLPFRKPRIVHAVSAVSFTLAAGECLGLVGETGCGKSTLARTIMQTPPPAEGDILFKGESLVTASPDKRRSLRRDMQYVFQDPFASLDPTWRVANLVAEPLRIAGWDRPRIGARVGEVLQAVGIDPARYGGRRPRELSGGQCQRVAVARALALSPRLLICDEVVSGLDVSIQAQLLNLFVELRRTFGLAYLFISHDLGVVRHLSDRVAVMYLGKIVEIGPSDCVYRQPRHPYTAALLGAVPSVSHKASRPRMNLAGELPSPLAPPSGCRFRTRCPRAAPRCAVEEPPLLSNAAGHAVSCHFPLTGDGAAASQPESVLSLSPARP
ncbi:oligopeptide/dipeptide ABC transporter ATP-binding protein [Enhydrobacter sp.]|jgi:oligopeptide/dipeptide ABC transporter ATP-binding protein|uniref:ABC transporter ATP-binding protein n=1 Tax=Enhydrobacter sp. TaxID=1894999 RepID=UPI0026354F0D|nr:oligopeptide/dipeptide ABC transporter ATP-binding protein [Enhydrobacter sp.]WIM09505.1 MAG: oligopeptide transport ATP-binding protein OppF [Enhydrobacter sp.]